MSLRPITRSTWRLSRRLFTRQSSFHHKPPPFPTIPSCPSPTCSCAETPTMPEGLDIDHSKPLNGTMAAYAEQVLICTGKDDWVSRIEEENSGDNLAADIKELMGRGGIYSDVLYSSHSVNGMLIVSSHFTTSQSLMLLSHPPSQLVPKYKQRPPTSFPPSNTSHSSREYPLTLSMLSCRASFYLPNLTPHTTASPPSTETAFYGATSSNSSYMVCKMLKTF